MAILFLDYDGVLHPDACKESDIFCHAPRLERVLRDFPAVEIVISSSWAKQYEWSEVVGPFSADIVERIIGHTPDYRLFDVPRLDWPR